MTTEPDVNPVLSPEELELIRKRLAAAEEAAERRGGMSNSAKVVANDIHHLLRHAEALQQERDLYKSRAEAFQNELKKRPARWNLRHPL